MPCSCVLARKRVPPKLRTSAPEETLFRNRSRTGGSKRARKRERKWVEETEASGSTRRIDRELDFECIRWFRLFLASVLRDRKKYVN